MSYRGRIQEDEFKIGKGRKVADSFSLSRAWQRGYPSSRLHSPSYIAACYSTSPQAVFKIISYGSSKKNLTNLVDYLIDREEGRVEIEGSDGLIMEDKDIADMLEEWHTDFKDKGSGKGKQRHFTHMLFSADVDPTEDNYQRVLETVRETAFMQFGQLGYEYKMVLHRDTDNPHVHIVLNNYNKITNKKLRLDRHDLFNIRSSFADNLSNNKLKRHVSTLRQDRPEFLHKVASELKRLNQGITDLESLLVNCAYIKRSNRLDAVLNKKIQPLSGLGFNSNIKLKLDFDSKSGYLQLRVKGVKNRKVNSALKQIAYRQLHSRNFGLSRDGSATLTIKDIKKLSPQMQKTVRDKFDIIIKQKKIKQTNDFGFNADIKLDFDFSKGYLQLKVKDVKNREINNALQQIAYKELNSRNFGLSRDGSATLTIKDIKKLSPQVQKMIKYKFDIIIKEKIDKQMARRSSDGLTKYRYLLKQTDVMLRRISANKQLSLSQKSAALKELREIRKKLIEGFDLTQITKGSQLAKSQTAIKAYQELDYINTKLSSKDYYSANKDRAIAYKKARTIEHKIDNLVRLGARNKNYKFANAKVVIDVDVGYSDMTYTDKSIADKPNSNSQFKSKPDVSKFMYGASKFNSKSESDVSEFNSKSKSDISNSNPKYKSDVSQPQSKSSIFTLRLNRTQNQVFDSVLVKVAKTIGSKDYALKHNPTGASAIIIKDINLTPELKQQIEFISKTIIKREQQIQDKFNDYKKQSILIKKTPTRTEFLHRRRALESFAIRQSSQIREAIKIFRRDKDSRTVTLLRGMLKESNYKNLIAGHQAVQNSIVKSRDGVRVGR